MILRFSHSIAAMAAVLGAGLVCAAGGCSGGGQPSGFGDGGVDVAVHVDAQDAPALLDAGDGPRFYIETGVMDAAVLTVQPANPSITVTVPGALPPPIHFQAFLPGESKPVTATWSLGSPLTGSIAADGTFRASGGAGAVATVTATAGPSTGSTTLTVKLDLTENPGGVSSTTKSQLEGGGTADPAFAWLYPYDQTVFPLGLTPPVLQFAGTAPDAVLLHATSPSLDYTGFYGASSPGQLTPSASTWTTLTESTAGAGPVTVEVTKISAGAVAGPIRETWTVAQGSLKGTIYYNSYDSPMASGEGAVFTMRPGTPATILEGGATGCKVCHAVSGNGSTMTLSNADYASGTSYALAPTGATQVWSESDSKFSFAGLYPDGTLALTNGALAGSWPPNVPGEEEGPRASQLIDPTTGVIVPASGFDGVVTYALMPTFSPDGTKVAFNHYDTGAGHSLAVMDFAVATKSFSGLVDVTNDPTNYLGWPAFLPDSAEFVYHADSTADFATWQGDTANIEMVDLKTMTVTPLNALNGLLANGTPYLPYGKNDINMNYEPTVLPVAVGGYYWVVFTSRREYGNTITESDPWQTSPAIRKKLWVAAIDLNPMPGKDPSHPAFYINDQELGAGNMRGFWALDPCTANGTKCGSGDQCCSGFCRSSGGTLSCVAPPGGCSQEYEKCSGSSDCCGASAGYQCINGYCSQPPPVK